MGRLYAAFALGMYLRRCTVGDQDRLAGQRIIKCRVWRQSSSGFNCSFCCLLMYQPFSSFASAQQGMTLLELMISMTLGVIILLGLSGLLFSSSASYLLQDQQA